MKKLLFSLLLCMFLVSTVSALEIDNTHTYNEVTREATFYNTFLGIKTSEIGKARLNTPLNVKVGQGYQKVAEFDLWAFDDYNDALKQVTFKDMKNGKEKINRDYDLKMLEYEYIEVEDFNTICPNNYDPVIDNYEVCNSVKVGTHTEIKEVWTKITPADLKKNEYITVGVFTEVLKGDFVDWIPLIYGEAVPEWATWTESLEVDLALSYQFESGTNVAYDDLGVYNKTGVSIQNTSGVLGSGFSFATTNANVPLQDISDIVDYSVGTIEVWIRADCSPSSLQYITQHYSGSPIFDRLYIAYETDSSLSVTWGDAGAGSEKIQTSPIDCGGDYQQLIFRWNETNLGSGNGNGELYLNGVLEDSSTNFFGVDYTGFQTWYLGVERTGTGTFDGDLDNFRVWNRYISVEEIVQLNNDNQSLETFASTSEDLPPLIILNAPLTNSTYNTNQNINFSYGVTDDFLLSDVKLYVNGVLNQTDATGTNNTNYDFNLDLSDGDYIIYAKATDNESQETLSDSIRVQIDTINPQVTINTPIQDVLTIGLPNVITLNATSTDTNLDICKYSTNENSTNITYTCNTNQNITFNTGGNKFIYVFAQDSFNNSYETNTSFLINYIQETAIYDTSVIEQEDYNISLNITASYLSAINGTLHYNGTDYNTTVNINGNTAILTTALTAPALEENLVINFNWTFILNGVEYNTSTYNHILGELTPLFFATDCTDKALKFQIQDEANGTALTGDIEFNFKYGISDGNDNEAYGSLSGVSTFYGCINATVSPNYTIGYGEIQYRVPGYVDRRYYLFEGNIISNETLTNITLRDLESTEQTSFILELEDTSLNKYNNRYTALWRWYPDLNEYKIVEMGKTDEEGQTVAHVNTEDVDYRLGLYEVDGTLIKLGDPKRYVCTLSPCTFTLTVDAEDIDYSSLLDVQAEITFNETSKIFTLIYNDPNQYTSLMRLEVTRETGENSLIICNVNSTGFTGVLSCDTSAYTGFMRAVAYRSASPEAPVAQKTNTTTNRSWSSSLGLFISIILWLAVILSGLGSSPVLTVILSVVALIPALVFGAINFAIFTGVAVLGAIVLHFIKRALAF